jgi:hypothetical protein
MIKVCSSVDYVRLCGMRERRNFHQHLKLVRHCPMSTELN